MRPTFSALLASGVAALLAGTGTGCKKSSSAASDAGTDTATTAGTLAISSNPDAVAYPQGLSVSAFSATDDSAAEVASAGTIAVEYSSTTSLALEGPPAEGPSAVGMPLTTPSPSQPPGPPGGVCYKSAQAAIAAHPGLKPTLAPLPPPPRQATLDALGRINGTSDCASDQLVQDLATMKGYIDSAATDLDGYGDCFMPDWGIVNGFFPGTTKDVCTVGYARNELSKLRAYVDVAKGLTEAMLCQALKDGLTGNGLGPGDNVDLTASLTKALTRPDGVVTTVKSATLARATGATLEYTSTFSIVPWSGIEVGLVIDHKPSDASNQAYSGVVRISHPMSFNQIQNGTFALSVDYAHNSDSAGNRVKYELRSGVFSGQAPFGGDGLVDYNVFGKDTDSSGNKIGSEHLTNMRYVTYDGYPDIDVAKLSYWVSFGGDYYDPARGMTFDVQRADGQVKGCAVAGATAASFTAGFSIRRALAEGYALLPVGYIEPFQCDTADNSGAKMWLQCFVRDASGAFGPDPSAITDVTDGFDFVSSAVVQSKEPDLADAPRPPDFVAAQFLPPPGAPLGPHMLPSPPAAPAPEN